ncbi:MAG: hypothetical protein E7267_08385 [Lachnospiraceae bacterium]|nr:hypothetical protein [Lachnospiraceae bacterium]
MKRIVSLILVFAFVISTCLASGVDTLSAGKMKLNKKKITLKPGEAFKLVVKNNKKAVKWTSSKKKVAKVSKKGKVKAKKIGNAKIIAKIGSKKLVCKVKVRSSKDSQNIQTTPDPQPIPGRPTKVPKVTPEPQVTKAPTKAPDKNSNSILDLPVDDSENNNSGWVDFDRWY